MKEHYEHLHANKLDDLEEIEKILERQVLRLTQEEIDNQNRSIKSKEIESIILKKNSHEETQANMADFYHTFKEE